MLAGGQVMLNFTEYPGSSLRCTAYHDGICPGHVQHVFGLFRGGDIAIGDERYMDGLFYRSNRIVLGIAHVQTSTSTAMHGQRLYADILRHPGNCNRITVLLVPAR